MCRDRKSRMCCDGRMAKGAGCAVMVEWQKEQDVL